MEPLTLSRLLTWAQEATSETIRYASTQAKLELSGLPQHGLMMVGWKGQLVKLEDLVSLLWHQNQFPRVVDLAVIGQLEQGPLVAWIPMGGQGASVLEETYNEGYGPFKPVGIMAPSEQPPQEWDILRRLGDAWLQQQWPQQR